MKLTRIITIAAIAFLISCENGLEMAECDTLDPICNQSPPTDEICLAHFQRWFFDKRSNSCSKIAYSGCSQKGFATKEECDVCKCN